MNARSFVLKTPVSDRCPSCKEVPAVGELLEWHDAMFPEHDSLYCPPARMRLWHTSCIELESIL